MVTRRNCRCVVDMRKTGADTRSKLIQRGLKLYRDFTGHTDEFELHRLKIPKFPEGLDTLVVIGECSGVLYDTVRDGEKEKYIHRFKQNSRPLFCITPDGNQIVLLGGAYKFTDRGIVDK